MKALKDRHLLTEALLWSDNYSF